MLNQLLIVPVNKSNGCFQFMARRANYLPKWASLPCADWPITKGLIFTKSATLSTIHFNTRLIR